MPLPNIDFTQLLIGFAVLLISLTVHEAAHAWSADQLGDPTARLLGRVSFNPAVHIDPIGTIVFPLLAMLIPGLPLIGWAKPVPVSIQHLRRNWRQKFMAIAAAGPASNLVLAAIGAIGFWLMGFDALDSPAALFLWAFVNTNVLLAVFNMLPVPPLDGGNVLSGVLHGGAARVFDSLRPYGFVILYALLLTGVFARIVLPIHYDIVGWLLP